MGIWGPVPRYVVPPGAHGAVRAPSLEEITEGAAFAAELSVTFPDTAED